MLLLNTAVMQILLLNAAVMQILLLNVPCKSISQIANLKKVLIDYGQPYGEGLLDVPLTSAFL